MGSKAAKKAAGRAAYRREAHGQRMTTAQAWHHNASRKPRNIVVSNVESIVVVRAMDTDGKVKAMKKISAIPVMHNMHQCHEFMAKHAEANRIPSTHYRHRLKITGERLVEDAGMFGTPKVMPVYTFRQVKTKFARKLARLVPRGKAYQKVYARALQQAMEAKS